MSLHTKELFERSEKAIKKIKKKLERLDWSSRIRLVIFLKFLVNLSCLMWSKLI
jgi:hypothetical protein